MKKKEKNESEHSNWYNAVDIPATFYSVLDTFVLWQICT